MAQKKDDPKHENHYKQIETIENDFYKIEFSDAHSQQAFSLVKVRITNKTDDYLFFEPSECTFKYDFGTFIPKGKRQIIKPNKSNSKVLKVTGKQNFHVEHLEIEINGLYLVPVKGELVEIEKFQLPAAKNSVSAGGFELNLIDTKQQTDETLAKFKCTFKGTEIGLLDPSKIVITTEKGVWANESRKSKSILMEKGDSKKFTAEFRIPGKILDMQFATMHMDWKDAFQITKKQKLEASSHQLTIDPGLTHGKNK